MTPALLLRNLEDALRPLVTAEKGTVFVCETPEETLSLLANKPGAFRCLIQWMGHDGDPSTYGSSKTGRIAVILQTARGLRDDRGADAHRAPAAPGSGGERPILELVSLVNTFVRSLTYLDDEGQLRDDIEHHRAAGRHQCFTEIGGDWLEIEGVALRQYQTNFSIRYTEAAE
jgi:hypothetical protein